MYMYIIYIYTSYYIQCLGDVYQFIFTPQYGMDDRATYHIKNIDHGTHEWSMMLLGNRYSDL